MYGKSLLIWFTVLNFKLLQQDLMESELIVCFWDKKTPFFFKFKCTKHVHHIFLFLIKQCTYSRCHNNTFLHQEIAVAQSPSSFCVCVPVTCTRWGGGRRFDRTLATCWCSGSNSSLQNSTLHNTLTINHSLFHWPG